MLIQEPVQFDSKYGNCYTFIVNESSVFVGPTQGLSLTLYTDENNNYLDLITSSSGFRVSCCHLSPHPTIQVHVHPSTYLSFPDELGFDVGAGEHVSVSLRQTDITRMDEPYHDNGCGATGANEGDIAYSKAFAG
jgi:hypothetical protein